MIGERLWEIIRFGGAGGISFAIELGVFMLLKQQLNVDTLIATPISFTVSVIVNYLLCVLWVFRGTKNQTKKSKIAFFLSSLIGLALNEILMLLFRLTWGEDLVIITIGTFVLKIYVLNKIISTCLVMVWNYFTKRLILTRGLEKADEPAEE